MRTKIHKKLFLGFFRPRVQLDCKSITNQAIFWKKDGLLDTIFWISFLSKRLCRHLIVGSLKIPLASPANFR
jgi:hypothetical protein